MDTSFLDALTLNGSVSSQNPEQMPLFKNLIVETNDFQVSEEDAATDIETHLGLDDSCMFQAFLNLYKSCSYENIRNRILEIVGSYLDVNWRSSANQEKVYSILEMFPSLFKVSGESHKRTLTLKLCGFIQVTATEKHFEFYSRAVWAATEIMELCNIGIITERDAQFFAGNGIVTSFSVFRNVSGNDERNEDSYEYIGEMIPFVATAMNALRSNSQVLGQQFWCELVIAGGNVSKAFAKWESFLLVLAKSVDPLIKIGENLAFANAMRTMDQAVNVVSEDSLRSSDQVAIIVNQLIPGIAVKSVAGLGQRESHLLLATVSLELLRAHAGFLAPFFQYFEVGCIEAVDETLEATFETIFPIYCEEVNRLKSQDRINSIASLAKVAFSGLSGKRPRSMKLLEVVMAKFLVNEPAIIWADDVMSCFVDAYSNAIAAGYTDYAVMAQTILEKAIAMSKQMLFVALCNCLIRRVKEGTAEQIPVYGIVSLMPSNVREEFMKLYQDLLFAEGQSTDTNPHGLATLTEMHNLMHSDKNKAIELLLSEEISPNILWIVWTHAILTPEIGHVFLTSLICRFITDIKNGIGIFATKSPVLSHVHYQEEVIDFLYEQLMSRKMPAAIAGTFLVMRRNALCDDSNCIPCLIALGRLSCAVLHLPNISINVSEACAKILVLVLLKVLSLKDNPNALRLITKKTSKVLVEIVEGLSIPYKYADGVQIVLQSEWQKALVEHQRRASASLEKRWKQLIAVLNIILPWLADFCTLHQTFWDFQVRKELGSKPVRVTEDTAARVISLFWNWYPLAIPPFCAFSMISLVKARSLIPRNQNGCPYQVAFTGSTLDFVLMISMKYWSLLRPMSPEKAIGLISESVLNDPIGGKYCIKCLRNMDIDVLLGFIPQLVQCLRVDHLKLVAHFLREKCAQSNVFATYLLWNLIYIKSTHVNAEDHLPLLAVKLEGKVLEKMSAEARNLHEQEFCFVENIMKISERLCKVPPCEREAQLKNSLNLLPIGAGVYVPFNNHHQVVKVRTSESRTLKSHTRVPLLVSFDVSDKLTGTPCIQPDKCIFKVNDDIRMDAMMIQLIDKFQRIFMEAGLDTYMNPYRIVCTGDQRGVLECISNAKSRDELGSKSGQYLLSYFIYKYGQIGTPLFNRARMNFIRSLAPYSLLCYLFEVTDRHNGNIMFDEEGHVIHIDFGFIFGKAPGGIKFEADSFKLTGEMIELLGGSRESPAFVTFEQLFHRCFIAARARYKEIEPIAYLMRNSGLNCFRLETFPRLRSRFALEKSDSELPAFIQDIITNAMGNWRTTMYDRFQHYQNDIFY